MNKLVLFLLLVLCSCSDLFDDFGGVNVPVINDVSSDNVQTTDPNPGNEYSDVTIVFNSNSDVEIMEKQIIKYGKSGNLQANTFTRDGYTFTGWNTKPDGSGTHYQDKEMINVTPEFLESLGEDATLTLYAQWEKTTDPNPEKEYSDVTIVFKVNDGIGIMEKQIIKYGKSGNLQANTFTRDGYTFTDWNTKPDGSGTHYQDKEMINVTPEFLESLGEDATLTLYAQWKETTDPNPGSEYSDVTIVFCANGGVETMRNQIIKYGESGNLQANTFTRDGYTFTGWNTKSDGNGASYQNEEVINVTSEFLESLGAGATLTLYAQWEKTTDPNPEKEYSDVTIVFNSNSDVETMEKQIIKYGESGNLQTNTFTRDGYTFTGWNTKSDGNGASYQNEEVINVTPELLKSLGEDATLTLYAQWEKTTDPNPEDEYSDVTIIFKANGGVGTMENQIIKSGESGNLQTNTFTQEGYTFTGWNTKSDGSGRKYQDKQNINVTSEFLESLGAGATLTLYAQWEKTIAPNPEDEYSDVTIVFNANDGVGTMKNQIIKYGEKGNLQANTFTRDGYTFTGWNTKPDGSGTHYQDKEKINVTPEFLLSLGEDVTLTLYAQWKETTDPNPEKEYSDVTIIFKANGGVGTMENQIIKSGESGNLQTNTFTQEGYTFTGWNTKSDGNGASYQNEEVINVTPEFLLSLGEDATLTLYAQWEKTTDPNPGSEYFLVPDINKLIVYKYKNEDKDKQIELIGDVELAEYFDQVADESGNIYFSYKDNTADKIVVEKYDVAQNEKFIVFESTDITDTNIVRLAYSESKLYLGTQDMIYDITDGQMTKIYKNANDEITAFEINGTDIFVAFKDEVVMINSKGEEELIYKMNTDRNCFIFDMQYIDDSLYLLKVECADFSYFYEDEYWKGSLVNIKDSQSEEFALSSSDFGNENSFYSPLRFFAVRKDELLIMDDGVVVEDWEIKQKNRLAIFKFDGTQMTFSDLPEELLYEFSGSI